VTKDPSIAFGLNTARGHVTNAPVAEALGLAHLAPADALT
jgi:alanine dehydrogenase